MTEILDLVRRRLTFIVVCGLIAAGVPAALATTSPDSYRATARLFVSTAAQDVTAANQGNLAAQSRVRSYALLAEGPELLSRAAQRSGVAITEDALARRISVSTPPDTVLLDIAATAGTPQEAAALSDAVSQELVTLVSQAERPLRGGSPSLGLLILQPADAGITKVPTIVPTQLVVFGVAGLVLGAVIAILVPGRFRLRRRKRIHTTDTDTHSQEPGADSVPPGASDVPEIASETEPTTSPSPTERTESRTRAAHLDAERHANWTTFDTLDAAGRSAPRAATNGHSRDETPPQVTPRPTPPPRIPDRRGWEDLTDPSGRLRPIRNGTPQARRHRRESGEWQFSPTNGGESRSLSRSARGGDEST